MILISILIIIIIILSYKSFSPYGVWLGKEQLLITNLLIAVNSKELEDEVNPHAK